jgi:hypothetical protein
MSAEPAALMVLAFWAEPGDRMVVRIRRTLDVRVGTEATSYARTRAEVLDEVVAWLDALAVPR